MMLSNPRKGGDSLWQLKRLARSIDVIFVVTRLPSPKPAVAHWSVVGKEWKSLSKDDKVVTTMEFGTKLLIS